MRVTVLVLFASLVATTASAKLPMWFMSTWPTSVSLVGMQSGVADSADGAFEVVVRDIANNPLAGSQVVLDLSGAPDLRLCADQGGNVSCTARSVSRLTDGRGVVRFALTGSGRDGVPASGRGTVLLSADGMVFSSMAGDGGLIVSAYDLDGSGGVGGNDLSLWIGDFASTTYAQRGDYNGDGHVGGDDLSLLLEVWGAGRSNQSCATVCP